MRVLIDVDGVVCDFVSGYLVLIEKVTGRSYTLDDVTDYDFMAQGIVSSERKAIEQLLFQPGWVQLLSPVEQGSRLVFELLQREVEIVFVTSPWRGHPTWASEREAWLQAYWPGVAVVSTHHKYLVHGDVLVDDRPEQVSRWHREWGPAGVGLLWDAPYNRRAQSLTRVHSWDGVLRELFGPRALPGETRP